MKTRRPGFRQDLVHGGQRYHVTVNVDPDTGRLVEVFIAGAKVGSDQDAQLDSAAILFSKLLQTGAAPAEIARTLGQQDVIGRVAAIVADEDGQSD